MDCPWEPAGSVRCGVWAAGPVFFCAALLPTRQLAETDPSTRRQRAIRVTQFGHGIDFLVEGFRLPHDPLQAVGKLDRWRKVERAECVKRVVQVIVDVVVTPVVT